MDFLFRIRVKPRARLSTALQYGLGKLQKLVQMEGDDIDQDGQEQALVIVHRNITKRHHALEAAGQWGVDPLRLGKQLENVTRALWNTQLVDSQLDSR